MGEATTNNRFAESAAANPELTGYKSIESDSEKSDLLDLTNKQKQIHEKLLSILVDKEHAALFAENPELTDHKSLEPCSEKLEFTAEQKQIHEKLLSILVDKEHAALFAENPELTDHKSLEPCSEKLEFTAEQKQIREKLLSVLDELKESFLTYGSEFFEKKFEREEPNNIEYLRNFLDSEKSEDLKSVLNFQREDGTTILHDVADFYPEVTKLLLGAGADPNMQDSRGKTPLHYATDFNCSESVAMLLNAGAEPNIRDEDGYTALHCIVNHEAPESTKILLNAGADPNLQNKEGDTPLHRAKSPKNIEILLNKNVNPNIPNKYGVTPLHIAAQHDYQENARWLLDKGADPNIEDNEGDTPFYLAVVAERTNIVELFLENSQTNINLQHKKTGESPIFDAVTTRGSGGVIADLIIKSEKVNFSIRNEEGRTVLHETAYYGQSNTVKLLLERGASIYDTDNEGRNPLHFASFNEWKGYDGGNDDESRENGFDFSTIEKPNANVIDIINTLVGHSIKDLQVQFQEKYEQYHVQQEVDEEHFIKIFGEIKELLSELDVKKRKYVNTEDKNGNTPLFYAIESKKHAVITKLLEEGAEIIVTDEKGAKVVVTDQNGYTPYHYAVKNKDPEILKLLSITPLERGEIINDIQHALMQNNSQEFSNLDNFVKQYNCLDMATYITEKVLPSISYKDNNEELIGKKIEAIFPAYMQEDKESYEAIRKHVSKIIESVVKTTNTRLVVPDKEGNTLLHHAVKWGCGEEVLDFLVRRGVDINAKNNNGVAPIHIAAKYGKASQMEFFIRNKADLNIQCGHFTKAETEILEDNFVTMQDGNMDANSVVSVKNDASYENATPTSVAANNLNADTVHMLASEGANPNIPNRIGATPLHIVAARILNKDYGEQKKKEIYEVFERLILSSTDDLLWYKKFIEVSNGDGKEKEELKKAIDNVIEDSKSPTAQVEESAPLPDENFYHGIGSHVKKAPDLCRDSAYKIKELAVGDYVVDKWDLESDHRGLERQREVTAEEIESEWAKELEINEAEWGKEDDSDKPSGAEVWYQSKADATSSSSDRNDGHHEQKQPTDVASYSDSSNSDTQNAEQKEEPATDINNKKPNTTLSDASAQEVTVEERSPLGQTKLIKRNELKLDKFLNEVSKAQNMVELNKIVCKALKAGIRINFSQGGGHNFTNCVMEKIHELEGAKKSARITSVIICQLTSRGAIFDENYKKINEEIKKSGTFKDHEINLQKANTEFSKRINEFQRVVKGATNGKLNNIEVDNTTIHLKYSSDSVVEVSEVVNGARSLGASSGGIVEIGESKVEIEINDGIRNYTGISGGDIILTFHTSLGALEVRLYSDEENKGIVKVEVCDPEKFNQLVKIKEEVGNCLLGNLSVYEAIKQGYFGISGSSKLQASETVNLTEKVMEEAKEIIKQLKPSDITVNSWVDKEANRSKIAAEQGRGSVRQHG